MKYFCECGKSFDTIYALNGHKANCKYCKQLKNIYTAENIDVDY